MGEGEVAEGPYHPDVIERTTTSSPLYITAPSNAKKTKGRPSRPIISANTEEWNAKIKAVADSVLARNGPTALSPLGAAFPSQEPEHGTALLTPLRQTETPSESEAEVEAEMSLPGKRQRSQSRLRMSWGPEDFEENEAEPSIVAEAVHTEPERPIARPPLPPSSPTTTKRSLASSMAKHSLKGKKRRGSDNLQCPVCLQTPFHLRYRCPVIEAGPDAIEKRLGELREEDTGHLTLLIEELELVVQNQRARAHLSKSGSSSSIGSFPRSVGALSPMVSTSLCVVKQSNGSPSSRRLTVPSGSRMSEVTVENQDEGSSNEGSDDESSDNGGSDEDGISEKQSNSRILPSTFPGASSLADMDLEAIIRGPASQSKSVLDDIPSRSISDNEDKEAEDEEADEEADDQLYRLRSKMLEKNVSSDEGEGVDLPAPSGGDSREESGDDEEVADIPLKPSTQPTQPLEDTSGTTQAGSQVPSIV